MSPKKSERAKQLPDMRELARRYFSEFDMGKRHYKRADMILREMIRLWTTEAETRLFTSQRGTKKR